MKIYFMTYLVIKEYNVDRWLLSDQISANQIMPASNPIAAEAGNFTMTEHFTFIQAQGAHLCLEY